MFLMNRDLRGTMRPRRKARGPSTALASLASVGMTTFGRTYERGVDDAGDLGGGMRACGDYGGECAVAGAVAGAGEAGRGSAICAADFLCALGVHRDCAGDVCGALFWVCAGTRRGQRAGSL